MTEHFEHDDCRNCGTASVPAEGVADQTLRSCPKCGNEWFEDLNAPPHKAATSQTAQKE